MVTPLGSASKTAEVRAGQRKCVQDSGSACKTAGMCLEFTEEWRQPDL